MRHLFVPALALALLLPAGTAVAQSAKPAVTDQTHTDAVSALKVTEAYVPEAPPTARVMAGFLILENPTAKALTLQGATSPQFGRVSLHETKKRDGVARMSAVDSLTVPAHGQVKFVPGGLHFMLYEPKQPLKAGDKVTLPLLFAGGGERQVTLPVRPRAAHGGHGHDGHGHDGRRHHHH